MTTTTTITDALAPFLELSGEALLARAADARAAFDAFLVAVEAGELRAATVNDAGVWSANAVVKQGILLGMRLGQLVQLGDAALPFVDKDTYPRAGLRRRRPRPRRPRRQQRPPRRPRGRGRHHYAPRLHQRRRLR